MERLLQYFRDKKNRNIQPETSDSKPRITKRSFDEQQFQQAREQIIRLKVSPSEVDTAIRQRSGFITNTPAIVAYALAATTQRYAEVSLTNEFSTSETVGNIYQQLTGSSQVFPDDRSAYEQLRDLTEEDPFLLVVNVPDEFPDAVKTSSQIRMFANEVRSLTNARDDVKTIVYSPTLTNIPTEMGRNLEAITPYA